jgi:hypothetical protein
MIWIRWGETRNVQAPRGDYDRGGLGPGAWPSERWDWADRNGWAAMVQVLHGDAGAVTSVLTSCRSHDEQGSASLRNFGQATPFDSVAADSSSEKFEKWKICLVPEFPRGSAEIHGAA